MRSSTAHIEPFRNTTHPVYKSDSSLGMNGLFVIPLNSHCYALVIASNGNEAVPWEHVSIRMGERRKKKLRDRIPTWEEMCKVKDIFWDKDECVMQLHPPQEDYVNIHPCVLHLWKPHDNSIPRPPKVAV